MSFALSGMLILAGSTFMLIAAIGVLRMPDLLMRMHSSTKAGTLGIGCLFLAIATHYGELGITTRSIAAIVFILLTAPVGSHVIGRAAYLLGTPLWEGTVVDELRESHDRAGNGGTLPDPGESS